MKTILLALILASTITACSKKSASCDDVYEHTMSLVPAELKTKIEGGKDEAIAKCEKMSPEAKQCALDAMSMEGLMKCPHS